MTRPDVVAERDQAVRAAWAEGLGVAELSHRFGVSETSMRTWLRRLELPLSHAPMPADAVRMRALWDEGLDIKGIAAAVGCPPSQVASVARRWSFPARTTAASLGMDGAPGKQREALPPGHPASWGLISAEPWPHLLPWQTFGGAVPAAVAHG